MAIFLLICFGLIGVIILLTPTEIILEFDGKTGRWLYEKSKNKDEGLKKAERFYNFLGGSFLLCSLIGLVFLSIFSS
ncbi:MAG: hypothetical protein JKY85_06030 [Porticoccus sp.]|nr:hypothetical protein [Porticoccus sp.]